MRALPQYIKKAVRRVFTKNPNCSACYGVFHNGRRWAACRIGECEARIIANHPKGGIYESWLVLNISN